MMSSSWHCLRPGVHTVQWNAAGFPSGIYFARLAVGQATFTNKMILSK